MLTKQVKGAYQVGGTGLPSLLGIEYMFASPQEATGGAARDGAGVEGERGKRGGEQQQEQRARGDAPEAGQDLRAAGRHFCVAVRTSFCLSVNVCWEGERGGGKGMFL